MPQTQQRLTTTGQFTITGNQVLRIPTGLQDQHLAPVMPQSIHYQSKVELCTLQRNLDGSFDVWNPTTSTFVCVWIATADHSQQQAPIPAPGLAYAPSPVPAPTPEIFVGHASEAQLAAAIAELTAMITNGDRLKADHQRNSHAADLIPGPGGMFIPYDVPGLIDLDQYPAGPPPNIDFPAADRIRINRPGIYSLDYSAIYSIPPDPEAGQLSIGVQALIVADPDGTPAELEDGTTACADSQVNLGEPGFETIVRTLNGHLDLDLRTLTTPQIYGVLIRATAAGAVLGSGITGSHSGTLTIKRIDQGLVTP